MQTSESRETGGAGGAIIRAWTSTTTPVTAPF